MTEFAFRVPGAAGGTNGAASQTFAVMAEAPFGKPGGPLSSLDTGPFVFF